MASKMGKNVAGGLVKLLPSNSSKNPLTTLVGMNTTPTISDQKKTDPPLKGGLVKRSPGISSKNVMTTMAAKSTWTPNMNTTLFSGQKKANSSQKGGLVNWLPSISSKKPVTTMAAKSFWNPDMNITTFSGQKKADSPWKGIVEELSWQAFEAMMNTLKKWAKGQDFTGKFTEDSYTMVAEVPGFDKADLMLMVNAKWLYVEGETSNALAGYKECQKYYRIPRKVVFVADRCTAEVLYGEVKVTLPLSDAEKTKEGTFLVNFK